MKRHVETIIVKVYAMWLRRRLTREGILFSQHTMHRDLKPGNKLTSRRGEVNCPPRSAEYILLLIPKRNREHLIGDLDEEYRIKVLPEWGPLRARFFYWEQTAVAVVCYMWPMLKRLLGLAAIWKVIGK